MDISEHEVVTSPSDTTESRRTLLRASLGGFAMAASGLFLPEGLKEAEAREGALGGAKGGRRGRDHKGRHRRHTHGDKKDKGKDDHDPPKGFFDNEGVLNIQFIFVNNNDAGTDPIGVTCYSYKWGTTQAIGWEDKTVPPETGVAFKTTVKQASLYIDHDRHIVWATNPYLGYPTIDIASGGGRGGAGPKDMHVDDSLSWQYDNYKITVTRNGDDGDYKVFSVLYES